MVIENLGVVLWVGSSVRTRNRGCDLPNNQSRTGREGTGVGPS